MQLPEYDDSGMTLLLITQLGDPDETPMLRAWQMFDGGAELTVVTAQGELIRAPFRSLEEFSRLLMRIDECYPGLLDSRLFSVHPSGVLVPLARWTAANGLPLPVLQEELTLTAQEFNRKFKDSPLKRAKRRGYLRNLAIAAGNAREPESLPALENIQDDEHALIRPHAEWAIKQIRG